MRNASEIFRDIQDLLDEVQELEDSGRVVMSTDSWNEDWRESSVALTAAREGLQIACDATRWMETLPPAGPPAAGSPL